MESRAVKLTAVENSKSGPTYRISRDKAFTRIASGKGF